MNEWRKLRNYIEEKGGQNMCSVGDAFNIDITEDVKISEYICKDCGKEFKGVGMSKVKCPSCKSLNTEPK